jgi:hypothetical protein
MKPKLKSMLFLTGASFIVFTGCKKSDRFIEPSALVTADAHALQSDAQLLQSNSRPAEVTFILTRGSLTLTGAIEASGTYTMNPVVQTGRTFHCTNNLVTPDGTITALTSCQSNSSGAGTTGTWRIVSGTGAYANLQGNGILVMYPGGETWTGKIF